MIGRGKNHKLNAATLLAACEAVEKKVLDGGLGTADTGTLERLEGLLESEEGANTVEEYAFSREDILGAAGEE